MRAALASTNHRPSVTRYFAATLLFFSPPAVCPANVGLAISKLRRQATAFAASQQQQHQRVRRSSIRRSISNTSSIDEPVRSSIARAGPTTRMSDSGRIDGNNNVPKTLTLPMFLEGCSLSARQQQQQSEATAAAKTAAPEVLFHVVSGNEACDADSMCSAICMALLKQSTAARATSHEDHDVVYVPVMPIPRADLALRREVLMLFEMCGVDPSALIFADELNLLALKAEGRLRLTLTDHNAVSGRFSGLGDSVVEIVDHHVDLKEHSSVQGSSRDIAFEGSGGSGKALVGSCCTIVAEKILDQAPTLLSSDVARLLLGVILIDTVNLDVKAQRATNRDIAAAELLSRRVSWHSSSSAQGSREGSPSPAGLRDKKFLSSSPPGSSTSGRRCTSADELFDALRNAKFDPVFWKEISATDALRYDYKAFHAAGESRESEDNGDGGDPNQHQPPQLLKFGMSSTLCRLGTLAQKGGDLGFGDAMRAFAVARRLDSLAVMTSTPDEEDNMRKELLIFTHTKLRCDQMREYFEGPNGKFLQLEAAAPQRIAVGVNKTGGGEKEAPGFFLLWEMGNVRPSRKQVAPAITSFYESVVGS